LVIEACREAATGVATMDEKQPMVYEQIPLGEEYEDEYVLTPELARDYAEGIEDDNPWYLEQSPFGRPIANPILILAQHARLFKTKYVTAGNVHTRHETQFINPAYLGKTIKVSGKLVEKYVKRGRAYLVMECRSVDEDGVEICRDRRTIITTYEKRSA
jgi:acyl dehydratase